MEVLIAVVVFFLLVGPMLGLLLEHCKTYTEARWHAARRKWEKHGRWEQW